MDALVPLAHRAFERRQRDMSWRNTLLLVVFSLLLAAATTTVIRFIMGWVF
jgi:hypothetical protein